MHIFIPTFTEANTRAAYEHAVKDGWIAWRDLDAGVMPGVSLLCPAVRYPDPVEEWDQVQVVIDGVLCLGVWRYA
jgi:hypothetical protein